MSSSAAAMHASVIERVLATWQIDNLEAILGPELSPSSWSQHLCKRLLALSRLVTLQQARDLLRNEFTSRLNDPARNRGVQRKHLCDIDVLHVVNAQQQQQQQQQTPQRTPQDKQPVPVTDTPISTRSSRRNRVLPESPDQADARPALSSRSPDLSATVSLNRSLPTYSFQDNDALQILARTAAQHQSPLVSVPPRNDQGHLPTPEIYNADSTANHGNHADTTIVVSTSPQSTPRAQATMTPALSKDRDTNPRIDTVFARLRKEREREVADLEGEVQKLRYELDIKKTQVQLYRHNHIQAQRLAERVRGTLDGLATEDEIAGQLDEYNKALADIEALSERYASVFNDQDDETLEERRRQTPHTPAHRNIPQGSSFGTPNGQDANRTPKVLLGSLHAAIEAKRAQRLEKKTVAKETRAAAEQEVKDAEAAVSERLAEADGAEADAVKLRGSLESLEKYLNSVKGQAMLLDTMDAC
ncbi:hypothetical protein CT0861_11733 [Colletotrichum tofieldiae]|uniref:Uncharacterized protein n=1 Tax=Colletotrichum tofieldiae TaxID=708197 RepID=A0A166NCE1_9PEZI|nr:hypothetical protein CT0861_11733 [Colletotrichum tofieldiae]